MRSLKIISVVLLLGVALFLFFFEQQMEKREFSEQIELEKGRVLHAAQDFRVKLASRIAQGVHALYGLRAYIETNPQVTQEEFARYAASIIRAKPSIRSVAGAPDMVVRYIYPLEGNEAALGLDYRTAPMAQRAAAFRTVREGKVIIAGPVKLVQGGFAFIVRIPVYIETNKESPASWGILAAPMDVDVVYQQAEMREFTENYDIALRGHDGLGSEGDVFFGNRDLFLENSKSVFLEIELENGSWMMAVKPKSGWSENSSNRSLLRAAFLAAYVIFSISWLTAIAYFDERIRARKRKLKTLREKSEFLEILSHEIRSPLQGVLGAQKYLLDNGIEKPMRTIVEEAHQSGEYIYSLINDYLDLQRAESDSLSVYLAPTNIREAIENSFKIATAGKRESSLAVNFYIAEDVPTILMLDLPKIRQILINLIGNALKYTSRGFVSIGAGYVDDAVSPALVLKIEDTGSGIKKSELAHLFDRFTRSESGERKTGSGLGLAIVKSLVKIMGGTISVESETGKGTTFFLHIPAEEATVPTVSETDKSPVSIKAESVENDPNTKFKKARVLIADDVVVNRILLNAMLSSLVEKVTLVEDGEQALIELDRDRYDLVIMDVHMPNMNGVEATKQIRANPKYAKIPIIGLTGEESSESQKTLFSVGMNAVLFKPIDLEPLLEKMEAIYSAETASPEQYERKGQQA